MRRFSAIVIFAAQIAGAPALANEPVAAPQWLRRPGGHDLALAYPILAQQLELSGSATISCVVNAGGGLQDCKVVAETPDWAGFGAAALSMANLFQMRSTAADGRPVAGGAVRIPIRFTLPVDAPVLSPPPPEAPAVAMAAARRLVDATREVEESVAERLAFARELEHGQDAKPIRGAAASAYRAAATRRAAELGDEKARVYAATFTPEELNGLVAHVGQSYSGISPLGHDDAIEEQISALDRAVPQLLWARVRDTFCRTQPCEVSRADILRDDERSRAEVANASPRFQVSPTPQAINAMKPLPARLLGLGGYARLTCEAGENGLLRACRPAFETPAGFGWGAAALQLSTRMQLAAGEASGDGGGRTVALRVEFPPGPPPPPKPAPPADTERRRLARELAEADILLRMTWRGYERFRDSMAVNPSPEMTGPTHAALASAVREAVQLAREDHIDRLAGIYAETFDVEQLSAAKRFQATPLGQKLDAKTPALVEALGAAERRYVVAIQDDMRAELCRTYDCRPRSAAPPLP